MRPMDRQKEMSATTRVFACQSTEQKFSNQTGLQSKRSDLDTLLELGAYHYPLNSETADVQNHGTNTIRALADMFTCKLSNLPVTVGIFTTQNDKEYLSHLASELRNISRLSGPLALRFSVLLFLFPLVVSTVLGYAVGMLTTWQVGLSIGHVGMFLQITILVIMIIGSRVCHNQIATRLSQSVAEFLRWLQLILNVCFCYPTRPLDARTPVRTIVVYHRLWPSTTPNVALFSMVDKMWTGLIRMHGEIPIRLQRASKPSPLPNQRFRRVCCLPAFLVVVAFCVAFMIETGMIRYYSGQIAFMLSDSARIAIFVTSTSILFLGLFGSIRSLCRLVRGLTINPVQPLRTALADFLSDEANEEEYNDLKPRGKYKCLSRSVNKANDTTAVLGNSTSLKNLAITAEEERARRADILIKEEFAKLCKLSLTFDRFLSQQQTRFVICLDASETKQCDVLAKLIYQIHNLVLMESTAPVAFVLEANFKVLLGDTIANAISPPYVGPSSGRVHANAPRTLSDNIHLVHTSLHLPIYLEPPIFSDIESEPRSKDLTSNSVNVSPNGFPSSPPTQSVKRNSSIMYTPRSIFGNRGSVAPLRSGQDKHLRQAFVSPQGTLSRNNSTVSRSIETCQGIAGLFLRDHELSDWNGKMMKQLVSSTSFTSRLLRLCNLEVPVDEIVLWITIVHYWPYHVAWLVVYLEGLVEGKANSTGKSVSNQTGVNLIECLREVKSRVAASISELEPLVTDDRNLDRLDEYLNAKASKPILLGSLKKLISCVLMHNPFVRHCIRAQLLNSDRQTFAEDRRTAHSGPFAPALTTLVEEQADPLGRSNQNIGSIGSYPLSRSDSGKGRLAHMSLLEGQPAHFFPCNADLLTSAEETPIISLQTRTKRMEHPIPVSQYTVSDVCSLVANIPEIDPEHRYIYQTNIRDRNVNGLMLYRIEPDRLKHEIGMNQAHWLAFSRSLQYLVSQENPVHGQPVDPRLSAEMESDSGSILSPLVISNKHPCVGSLVTPQQPQPALQPTPQSAQPHGTNPQHRLIRSSPSSSLASSSIRLKNPNLIRQTPWLLSPQVPTSLMNSDTIEGPENDIVFPSVYQTEPTENQASLSGMEEPESLWKSSPFPISSKSTSKQRNIGECSSGRSAEKPNSLIPPHEQLETESRHALFSSPRSSMKAHAGPPKQSRKSVGCPREEGVANSLASHRNRPCRSARSDTRKYNSRSTVDLRTAFGPLAYNPQATELYYREGLQRKSKGRRRVTRLHHMTPTNDPQLLFSHKVRDGTGEFEMNMVDYESQQPQIPADMAFSSVSMSHRNSWRATAKQPEEDVKDLRRMKKRICRRSSRSNQESYDLFVNKNAQEADLILPSQSGHNRTVIGPHDAILIDSESDSVICNPALITTYPGVVPWTGLKVPRRERRGRKLHPSPALNSAQLASLYSFVTHSGKIPALIQSPFEIPYEHNMDEMEFNSSKPNYLQIIPANYSSHGAEPSESYKPSQKKRARQMELGQTTMINSPRLVHSMLKTGLSNEPVQVDYLDEGTNSPESDAEECTCEYWYGIDRNGGKVTISEPTLRGDSDDLYSDDNMQIYCLENEVPKRSSRGAENRDFKPENEMG